MSEIEVNPAGLKVQIPPASGKSVSWEDGSQDSSADVEREQFNTQLEWIRAHPPSDEELEGKLFIGWYQTEDITGYKLSGSYRHNHRVDMKSIIDDIPRFIASCREPLRNKRLSELPEIGKLLQEYQGEDLQHITEILPKLLEDCRASLQTSTTPSITNSPRSRSNQNTNHGATSSNPNDSRLLTQATTSTTSSEPHTLYVMLDYLLEISVPEHLLHHFSTFKNKVHNTSPRSRPQSARSRNKHGSAQRWVFVACHCDVSSCYGNLFHCLDSLIPVLVVAHEKYEQFVEVCKNSYVVVRLPSCVDKTTGYFNYWIQLIARKLSLEQIWIVDDRVKSFYRAIPNQRLPLVKSGSMWSYDIPRIRPRLVSFTEVMKHLEDRMEEDEMFNATNPMSIIGLSNEICAQTEPYSYNIPIGAILLNLRNLGDLKFHPELHQIDTQVLACEAVKSGQRVFVCNSFVLLDASWDSAPSPS